MVTQHQTAADQLWIGENRVTMWCFSNDKQMSATHRYNCAMSVKAVLQFQHVPQFAERPGALMAVSLLQLHQARHAASKLG